MFDKISFQGVYTRVAAFQRFIENYKAYSAATSIHTWKSTTLLFILYIGIRSIKI
jgi:hypothetical protein